MTNEERAVIEAAVAFSMLEAPYGHPTWWEAETKLCVTVRALEASRTVDVERAAEAAGANRTRPSVVPPSHQRGCSCFDCVGAHVNVEERNAKAAKWDAATQGGRVAVSGLSNVVMAIELAQLRANARRWRTVERAVDNDRSLVRFMPHGDACSDGYTVTAGVRYINSLEVGEWTGPTLAVAVDQMQERMDKEATP